MEERRRSTRMLLDVPVRVEGHDADGTPWSEMARTGDVSDGGLSLQLEHPVEQGSLLYLSLPLPRRFRRHDPAAAIYKVFALVRAVGGGSPRRVGTRFLGLKPPKGHLDNPGMRYRLPGDEPRRRERRGDSRLDIYVNVVLRCQNGRGEERTIAENIGRRGARTLTSLAVQAGEVLHFEELDGDFRTRAEVRNAYVGDDRIRRLNLYFLDGPAPERLFP